MCNPAVAYWAVAALTAYGEYQQGSHEKDVSRYNARVLENEAVQTRNKGVDEEMRHREKVQQIISKQRAQIGASGVSLESGSPLQLQEDAALLGEVDALRIRENFQDRATALDDKATLVRSEGDQAYRQGIIGAATAIGMAYAGSDAVSSSWYNSQSQAATSMSGTQANDMVGAIA